MAEAFFLNLIFDPEILPYCGQSEEALYIDAPFASSQNEINYQRVQRNIETCQSFLVSRKCSLKSYGKTKLETPVPVRSLKLSNLGYGYWLALGWVTNDHSSVEVDAVAKNTVKSQEWRNGASNIYS